MDGKGSEGGGVEGGEEDGEGAERERERGTTLQSHDCPEVRRAPSSWRPNQAPAAPCPSFPVGGVPVAPPLLGRGRTNPGQNPGSEGCAPLPAPWAGSRDYPQPGRVTGPLHPIQPGSHGRSSERLAWLHSQSGGWGSGSQGRRWRASQRTRSGSPGGGPSSSPGQSHSTPSPPLALGAGLRPGRQAAGAGYSACPCEPWHHPGAHPG